MAIKTGNYATTYPGIFRCLTRCNINVPSAQNVQNYVQTQMGASLKQFIGAKLDDQLSAQIKNTVVMRLGYLQSQGIIYDWVVNAINIKDGLAEIQMDIQPSVGSGKVNMSERNYLTHNWEPGKEIMDYKCKDCGIAITIIDKELPVIISSDNLNCNDYAIKEIIE